MLGDALDLRHRLRALLPARWFADVAPNLDALLGAMGVPWSWLYASIGNVELQARLSTATGQWLDMIARDFFGSAVPRLDNEGDGSYRARIKNRLFQPSGSREAVSRVVEYLTGSEPWIFEPRNTADTGGYGHTGDAGVGPYCGLAYGSLGGWGSLALPFQFFMIVRRPIVPGMSSLPGYSTPLAGYGSHATAYSDVGLRPGAVSDQQILRSIVARLPANAVSWVKIV